MKAGKEGCSGRIEYQLRKSRFSNPNNVTNVRDWGKSHVQDTLRKDGPLVNIGEFIRKHEAYFLVSANGEIRLNLELPEIVEAQRHVHKRLGEMVVDPNVRNQELLEDPFFRRIGITTTQELNEHMLNDKKRYADDDGIYYMPLKFVQVNDGKVFGLKRFNWDTESHEDALRHAEPPSEWTEEEKRADRTKRLEIARDELRLSIYIMDCWRCVVNAPAEGLDDRTQPPRHTTMIRRLWEFMTPEERAENQEFFNEMWDFAKREYWTVWNALDPNNPYLNPQNPKDILHQNVVDEEGEIHVRYGHKDVTIYNDIANLASGHDKTRDAYRRERDFTRIQLEMYLWQAEGDFAWEAEQSERPEKEKEITFWKARQAQRADRVIKNHKGKDWFYHYDFVNKGKSSVEAVTGFLAYSIVEDENMRKAMLDKLKRDFLGPYGLMLTTVDSLPQVPSDENIALMEPDPGMQRTIKEQYKNEQWEGPNQFFNITSQIVDVLIENKEYETAALVMEHTLVGLLQYYKEHGKFPEKINVLTGEMGNGAEYGDQDELMMPAGIFAKFMRLLPEVYAKLGVTPATTPSHVVFDSALTIGA